MTLSIEKAQKVIDRLEGTLIADLQAIKIAAEMRQQNGNFHKKFPGGLNFSLFLIGLIASETIGFFIKEGSKAGRTEENIRSFISSNYFKESAFKKEKYLAILVSLRTNLAHVFGMTDLKLEYITTDLRLCVGGSNKAEIISTNGDAKLNGIKFVEYVIDGFESIKSEVLKKNEESIVAKIISSKV